jgi:SAM-dependent methyltransferase
VVIRGFLTEIIERLRRDGASSMVRPALRYARSYLSPDPFDSRHGTNTGRIEPLWKLKTESPNLAFAVRYQATKENEFYDALKFVNEEWRHFTFIDLGSGKGRTLLMAANLGFQQIIGVEFSEPLVSIARTNLAKKLVSNAVVLHADAASFQFPDSDIVLYLFNPFSEVVMRQVILHLKEIASRRKCYVIYNIPECSGLLEGCGFLTYMGSVPKTSESYSEIGIWKSVIT